MIYTTYFANIRKLTNEITPIAICAKPPIGYSGIVYKSLAPKYDTLMRYKDTKDEKSYVSEYKSTVLNQLDVHSVVDELYALSKTKDIALVCYEKPSDFCHRHLVCDWLNENGIECSEYQNN